MKRKIIFFIILIIFLLNLFFFWQVFFKKNNVAPEIFFEIKKGDGFIEIGKRLEEKKFISHRYLFYAYALFKNTQSHLMAGKYNLSGLTIREIVQKISHGWVERIKITFPEGITLKEIEKNLKENNILKDSLSDLKIKDFPEFDFLKGGPPDLSLEGFLFPDTYFFYPEMEAREVALIFLQNFEKKIFPFKEEIKKKEKTIFEIVTMASILEKEIQGKENKQIIAGILWKRLKNNMRLQVDSTVNYATGKKTPRVSIEDTKIDSPYNTYKYKGLPLGPISNPSLESIYCALFPQETDFWFYITTPDNILIPAKTFDEHLKNKRVYLK